MRFDFEQNDKRFCSNDDKRVLLRQGVFLQISFILQKANSFILFSLHFLSQKLKGRRIKRKKKERKLSRKRRRIEVVN